MTAWASAVLKRNVLPKCGKNLKRQRDSSINQGEVALTKCFVRLCNKLSQSYNAIKELFKCEAKLFFSQQIFQSDQVSSDTQKLHALHFRSLFSFSLFLIHNFDFQCMIAINMAIISTIVQYHITKYTMLIFTLHWKCQIIANFWLFQMQLDARPASELIAKRFRNKTEDSEMNKKNCKLSNDAKINQNIEN